MSGDDDTVAIRRHNNTTNSDVGEVDTTNGTLASLLGYIAPNSISSQPVRALYNSLVTLTT